MAGAKNLEATLTVRSASATRNAKPREDKSPCYPRSWRRPAAVRADLEGCHFVVSDKVTSTSDGFQPFSGLYSVIAAASDAVFGPRTFSRGWIRGDGSLDPVILNARARPSYRTLRRCPGSRRDTAEPSRNLRDHHRAANGLHDLLAAAGLAKASATASRQ